MSKFRKEIQDVINRHSKENGSNTPDFILAEYLVNCLKAFDNAVNAREEWYGKDKESEFEDATINLGDSGLNKVRETGSWNVPNYPQVEWKPRRGRMK